MTSRGESHDVLRRYKSHVALYLGVILLLLGLFSVSVGIQALILRAAYCNLFYGIWAGAVIAIAGLLATLSGVCHNGNMVAVSTVTSLLSIIASLADLVLGSISLYYNLTQSSCSSCSLVDTSTPSPAASYCSAWSGGSVVCLEYNAYQAVLWDEGIFIAVGTISTVVSLAVVSLCGPCCLRDNNKVTDMVGVQEAVVRSEEDVTPANFMTPEKVMTPAEVVNNNVIAHPKQADQIEPVVLLSIEQNIAPEQIPATSAADLGAEQQLNPIHSKLSNDNSETKPRAVLIEDWVLDEFARLPPEPNTAAEKDARTFSQQQAMYDYKSMWNLGYAT